MREILYKAKCENWKNSSLESRWIIGGYAEFNKKSYIIVLNECVNPNTGSWDMEDYYKIYPEIYSRIIEIDKKTLSQFTGLTDKNGRKIFEGDIVKDKHGNLFKAFWNENLYQFSFICIKSNNSFMKDIQFDLWYLAKKSSLIIYGNIFDNTELIGE